MTSGELSVGDVVVVCLDPSVGMEQRKTRPCVVLESTISPLKLIIILPITDADGKTASKRIFVPIIDFSEAGLEKASVIDCFQIRAVDRSRIIKTVGAVSGGTMDSVRERLAKILDIGSEHIEE